MMRSSSAAFSPENLHLVFEYNFLEQIKANLKIQLKTSGEDLNPNETENMQRPKSAQYWTNQNLNENILLCNLFCISEQKPEETLVIIQILMYGSSFYF